MKRRTFLAGATAASLAPLARPAIAQDNKKLTFLSWNIIDQADMFKKWFAAFRAEHPGVEIEWLDKKGPDVPAFYQTQLAGGTPPDVVDLQGGIGIEYAAQGALLDLTPYLAAHPDVKARYNPDYLKNWVWEGKNWLVPFYVAKSLLFYNKTLFKKAGLPGPATNFDDLMAYCDKIGAGGDEQTGFLTLTFDWLYWALFKLNGIELLSPDLKTPEFDTDKMAAVVARMAKSTAGTGINKISWTGRWVEPLGAFASGKVGMLNAIPRPISSSRARARGSTRTRSGSAHCPTTGRCRRCTATRSRRVPRTPTSPGPLSIFARPRSRPRKWPTAGAS